MLLIFVYSCFWILYFQNFGSIIWYLRDFVDPTPVNAFFARFGITFNLNAEHVTVINAGTIVVLQIVVNLIVRHFKPLPTMIVGILFGAIGFLLLASSQFAWIFILGIVVFSIGEMTCHPKYYSYIGLVAPQDKKALYMGYAFLYGVIGSLVGSNVGGEMYYKFLTPLVGQADVSTTLRNFWLVFAVLGIATMLLLLLYNKIFGEDTADTRRKARLTMFAIYGILVVGAVGMVFFVYSAKEGVIPPKTWIQSGIMFLVGIGGLYTLIRAPGRETT
jgi:dipeptide/tripeptide permease